MNFMRKRRRLKICILFVLLLFGLFLVLSPVAGSQCILVKEMAKCGGMNLNEIPQSLPTSITSLDLSNNSLAKTDWIPLRRYRKTKILIMNSCNVDAVPADAFQKLHHLLYVDLSYNRLTHVDKQIFKLNTKIVKVLLNGNNLQFDSESPFLISYSITSLELRDCGIRQISSVTFTEMKKLQYLDLSINEINTLDSRTFHYNVFNELKIDPVKQIFTDLNKVCGNGAVVRYHLRDKPENWCETRKSKEIETTKPVVKSLKNSIATWVSVLFVMLIVMWALYHGIRYCWNRKGGEYVNPQDDSRRFENNKQIIHVDDDDNENSKIMIA